MGGGSSETGFGIDDIVNFYKRSAFDFGGADIFCCGPTDTLTRISEVIFVLSMVRDKKNQTPISQFTAIFPPSEVSGTYNDASIRQAFSETVARQRGKPLDEEEQAILKRRLNVVHANDFQTASAIAVVDSAKRNSVLIMCEAARYRHAKVSSLPESTTLRMEEDVWTPHLRELAEDAVTAAKRQECYIVLDAGQFTPHRRENLDALKSVADCGVLGAAIDNDPDSILATHGDEWFSLIKAGRIGSVLSSIDDLPAFMDRHKPSLKIQLLHKAGLPFQAVELIRSEIAASPDIPAEARVKFAIIAGQAGEGDFARDLLATAIPLLRTAEWIEQALSLASELGEPALEQESAHQLECFFPQSEQLYKYRLRRLLEARDYGAVQAMLASSPAAMPPDAVDFYAKLASTLSGAAKPDYRALLNEVAAAWPVFAFHARLACICDADARGLFQDALALALPLELAGTPARQSAWALLRVVEQLLIRRSAESAFGVEPDDLVQPTMELVRYLARNPGDSETRLAIANLLSVQLAGTFGLPIIAIVTLQLIEKSPPPVKGVGQAARPSASGTEFEEIEPFFKEALEWLARERSILGRCALPSSLLTKPAHEILDLLARLIEHAGSRLVNDADYTFIEQLLLVAMATAPHSNTPDFDLVLLRVVAGHLALAGRVQRARDLAEHGLQLAGENPKRVRLAWYGFADVYQRLNNPVEALLAMASALACGGEIDREQAWYETHGLIRLLRDLNLTPFVMPLLPRIRELARELGWDEQIGHRLVTIELSVRFRDLATNGAQAEELARFVGDVEENCRAVMERYDELTPVAMLLAQAIHLAQHLGIAVRPEIFGTLDCVLTQLGEPNASMIRTMSAARPKAAEVLAIATRLERARYSEDVGFDVRFAEISARRLLDSDEAASNPKVAAFAIELLADQGFKMQASPAERQRSALPLSIEEPAQIALEISRAGISVHLLAMAESGRLVRLTANNGDLGATAYEPADVFSKEALSSWSARFPYQYGFETDDPNAFYSSMRHLGLTLKPTARSVLVMDVSLQQIPANLLLVSGELIGRRIAMAAAPSLTWLRDARARTREPGKHAAWIPIGEDGQTLAMIAERLGDTFRRHAVILDTNAAIPGNLSGSDLAIVIAHGGIIPEGRFFQVVSDDTDMRITASALASAVRNARLVILFVCSAGRFDKHPSASTTVGLAKGLLDRGCSCVIASPWPLHVSVPAYWMPTFLDAWSAGVPAIDANFEANKAVGKALGDSPAYSLAMTVFGDPLVSRLER